MLVMAAANDMSIFLFYLFIFYLFFLYCSKKIRLDISLFTLFSLKNDNKNNRISSAAILLSA